MQETAKEKSKAKKEQTSFWEGGGGGKRPRRGISWAGARPGAKPYQERGEATQKKEKGSKAKEAQRQGGCWGGMCVT